MNNTDSDEPSQNVPSLASFQSALVSLPESLFATYSIILANAIVYGLMVANGADPFAPAPQTMLNWGANFGPMTMNGQWWRLFTHMFLHFGIVHFGLNMWVLWSLSRMVERFVGRIGFLICYFVCGIAGGITSLAWHPIGVSAGASGAVFGIAGVLFGFVVLRRDTIPGDIRYRTLTSMGKFLLINTVIGLSIKQVDMAAHTGGFIAGLICGLILSQPFRAGMATHRLYRNLATTFMACVAIPLGIASLPAALPDVQAEMERYQKVEYAAHEYSIGLAQAFEKEELDNLEYANGLERVVLPPWKEERQRIAQLVDLESVDREYMLKLVEYMQLREAGWQLLADGLRENRESTIEQAWEKSRAADEFAAREFSGVASQNEN